MSWVCCAVGNVYNSCVYFVDVVFVLKLLLLFAVDSMSGCSAKVFIELWTFMAKVNKTPLICRIIYGGWHFYKLIDLHSWNDLELILKM